MRQPYRNLTGELMNNQNSSRLKLFLSMSIFGTIGIFRNYIDMPSSIIAMSRGLIGMLFLLLVILLFKRSKISFESIKKNSCILLISGVCIGINWILLFEAYRYTTVSTATLCYYMAPVFVILLSPFVFKERFTAKKAICTLCSILGMLIISGIFGNASANPTGIILGLGAAMLYASVVMMNKFIKGIRDEEKTLIQLGAAGISLVPYVLLTESLGDISAGSLSVVFLIIVGVIHTGIAYSMYFGSIDKLNVQTVAISSYIDPVVALILSALLLHEEFTWVHLIGSILILGAAFISEMPAKKELK